jgi:arylsulfatase A-like enzyme
MNCFCFVHLLIPQSACANQNLRNRVRLPTLWLPLVACLAFCFSGESLLAAETRPPNVVVFLADDAGWGDYGIHGNKTSHTPNIDSIAKNGVRFDRFFVCSVCAPTRAEFLTGRYHSRGGVRGVSTGQERLNLDEKTIADCFLKAGYATGAFGKWHNGSQWPYHPMARGFQQYYGHTSGHWGEYFDPPLEHNAQMVRDKGYIVDLCTNRAMDFIEANQSRPFFCYVPFTTPHSPWGVPEDKWNKYKDKPLAQPATEVDKEVAQETRCVYAMLENQDDNVGRVLRRLKELQLEDDTIVVYFSDNGPNTWRWNDGMKGKKGSVDEGGNRSPLFISWPGRIKNTGRVLPEIAGAVDLLPTLLSLTGVSRVGELPLDGRDLSRLIHGSEKSWPDRQLIAYQGGSVAVRTQQYRLDATRALYDMQADPAQLKNIADTKPEVAKTLAKTVDNWRKEVFGLEAISKLESNESKGKKKDKSNKLTYDDRPFPVGYSEFPWTPLPARDGVPHEGVKRSSGAPNCSYFVDWKSEEGYITWDIDVHEAGTYDVMIEYTCPKGDAGSTIELSFKDSKLLGKVSPEWDPPLYTNQDAIPRPSAESKMKEFRPLKLGTITLASGRDLLKLRVTEMPGSSVMDLLSIHLTLQK